MHLLRYINACSSAQFQRRTLAKKSIWDSTPFGLHRLRSKQDEPVAAEGNQRQDPIQSVESKPQAAKPEAQEVKTERVSM